MVQRFLVYVFYIAQCAHTVSPRRLRQLVFEGTLHVESGVSSWFEYLASQVSTPTTSRKSVDWCIALASSATITTTVGVSYYIQYLCPTNRPCPSLHHFCPPLCGIQVKDREAYYTDLQLLRVTKKLQAVLKGDRGEKDKELVQKTEARVEMMERSHESKVRNTI